MPTTVAKNEIECRFAICFCMIFQRVLDGDWKSRVNIGHCLSDELKRGSDVLDQTSKGPCAGSPISEAPTFWRVFVEIVFLLLMTWIQLELAMPGSQVLIFHMQKSLGSSISNFVMHWVN